MLIFWSCRWLLVLCLAKDYVITSWVTLFNAKIYYYSSWAKYHYRFFAIRRGINIWVRSCKIFPSLLLIKSQTQIIAMYQRVHEEVHSGVMVSHLQRQTREFSWNCLYLYIFHINTIAEGLNTTLSALFPIANPADEKWLNKWANCFPILTLPPQILVTNMAAISIVNYDSSRLLYVYLIYVYLYLYSWLKLCEGVMIVVKIWGSLKKQEYLGWMSWRFVWIWAG